MKKIIILVLGLSIFLTACRGITTEETVVNSGGQTVVRVGLTGSDSKTWNHIAAEAAKEDIKVELVFFDSYPLPNAALDSGDIDMNAFQHHIYLNKEVDQHGYELSVIGETVLAPLGIYSKQIEGLGELEDGSKIVVPDDVTNGGRALLLLQDNGLIGLDPEAGDLPSLKDIQENPRNFEIIELAATNIPASLEEVPIAVINSGVARDAGFIPSEDSIVLEEGKPGENKYVNIIVVRTEDRDSEVYNRIVELYHTDEVKDIIAEDSKGSSIPVW